MIKGMILFLTQFISHFFDGDVPRSHSFAENILQLIRFWIVGFNVSYFNNKKQL